MKFKIFVCLIIGIGSIVFNSCGENEDPVNEIVLTDDDIIGTWTFIKVSTEATISGVPQSSTDDNPTGFVEFKSDYTGSTEFNTELIGFPFEEAHTFTWERISDFEVNLTQDDDMITDEWTVTAYADNRIEANWDIDGGSVGQATIFATLEKE